MPTFAQKVQVARELCRELMAVGFRPFLGTPSGILSPFYSALERHDSLLIVARDDNAIGVAAGASLAGQYPVVLMEISGLGQSVTVIASLVVYRRISSGPSVSFAQSRASCRESRSPTSRV